MEADYPPMTAVTLEVEVKARLGDARAFEKNIVKAGARRTRDVIEEDTYYSHPCRDLASTDEALRIRRAGKWADLTYKGPKLDKKSKTREEIVTPLGGPEGAALLEAILLKLGFGRVAQVRKRRRVYNLGRFELCVDHVDGLGDFVEIEARGPRNGYAKLRDEALALLEKLGGGNLERRSYLELLLATRNMRHARGND